MSTRPEFPLTVHWLLEDEREVYSSPEEAEMNLEFFDSDDGEAIVTDRLGRRVVLKVDVLSITRCELEQR